MRKLSNLFYAEIQVARSFKRFDSLDENFSQFLAHSVEFDALGSDRVENDGTIGIIVHQFGGVARERIGPI